MVVEASVAMAVAVEENASAVVHLVRSHRRFADYLVVAAYFFREKSYYSLVYSVFVWPGLRQNWVEKLVV